MSEQAGEKEDKPAKGRLFPSQSVLSCPFGDFECVGICPFVLWCSKGTQTTEKPLQSRIKRVGGHNQEPSPQKKGNLTPILSSLRIPRLAQRATLGKDRHSRQKRANVAIVNGLFAVGRLGPSSHVVHHVGAEGFFSETTLRIDPHVHMQLPLGPKLFHN